MEESITPRYPPIHPLVPYPEAEAETDTDTDTDTEVKKEKGSSGERCPALDYFQEVMIILFNFEFFARIVETVYATITNPYSLEEVLSVFRYFFQAYEDAIGSVHPGIRREQIARIIEAMPYVDKQTHGQIADIAPEDYPELIDAYFRTSFPNCDYRINHFFSGQIRELRFYEELY